MMSDTVDCCDIRSITAKISDTVHHFDNRYSGICFIRYSRLFDLTSDMKDCFDKNTVACCEIR